MVNKKRLLSCALLVVFALNNVAFAAEDSKILVEEMETNIPPVEITNVTLEGYNGTYDSETGEYVFEQAGEIMSRRIEEEFSIDIGDINTETLCSDEMILIESGREGEIQNLNCESEIMTIENSLADLMVYDLAATTDLIVGQEQNRFSYKVANLGSSVAQNVEVTFVVDNRVAGTYNIGDIGASQAVGGYFVLGKVSQAGTHGIGVYADYRDQIEESNEANNFLGKYFTWYDEDDYAPDLTVEITSPTNNTVLNGTFVDESNKEKVEFEIANIGPVDSPDNKFTLYVYADGKPITGMRVSPMKKFTALSGSFQMNVNAYKTFELEMVVDTLNEVKEANENNNSDSKDYDVFYCTHHSINITHPPFPANNVKVQLEKSAYFGEDYQEDFYKKYLGVWNGITDDVKIKSVTVSNVGTMPFDDTQIFIYAGAENCGDFEPAFSMEMGQVGKEYVVIELNDAFILNQFDVSDMVRTLTHELGHAFGMAHPNGDGNSCNYASVMNQHSYTESGLPTEKRSQGIASHDKYALKTRYEELATVAASIDDTVDDSYNKVVYVDKAIRINSEDVLTDNAMYIVKGRILPNKENVLTRFFGYTQTELIVDEVYKGTGLTQGEVIKIKEPYFTDEEGTFSYKTVCKDNYIASQEGEEYVFFLNKQGNSDLFTLPFTTLSRYATNKNVIVEFPGSNNIDYSAENYNMLKDAVMEKYN